MRRIEPEAADARVGERQQLLGPPADQRGAATGVVEIGVRDVVFAMHMARIEPRLCRFGRVEPVGMFGVERAVGGHPVDHQIGQQGQARFAWPRPASV